MNISYVFPNRGGTSGMPSQGVQGAGGNNNGNESLFSAQAFPVHHNNT